jgi:hypothetical protein
MLLRCDSRGYYTFSEIDMIVLWRVVRVLSTNLPGSSVRRQIYSVPKGLVELVWLNCRRLATRLTPVLK